MYRDIQQLKVNYFIWVKHTMFLEPESFSPLRCIAPVLVFNIAF